MKKISKGTFLRAKNSHLAQVRTCEYGDSLFGDYKKLIQINDLCAMVISRDYYNGFETIEENFYKFDSKKEALEYFSACQEYAEEYSKNHDTVAVKKTKIDFGSVLFGFTKTVSIFFGILVIVEFVKTWLYWGF